VAVTEHFERYDQPSDPTLTVALRSEHFFSCLNDHLDHLYQRRGTVLDISLTGVSIGPVCLTALGPATAAIQPNLSNGIDLLNISMDGRTDSYDVEISDSAVRLTPRDTVVSGPEPQLVWRYPPQSFAYYCGTLTHDTWLCDAFRDSLQSKLSLILLQPPSFGVWPYPLRSEGYDDNASARFYRYATEADFDSAGAMLRSFAQAHLQQRSGVGLSLRNWRNAYYHS
jgi:hypothetical protein